MSRCVPQRSKETVIFLQHLFEESVGFCRVSRVEGKMSRVEGKMSSVEGKMSRVH